MSTFMPKEFDTLTIEYDFTPEEKQTWEHPGCPPEIEFMAAYIDGQKIESALFELFIEVYGDTWERELINGYYI